MPDTEYKEEGGVEVTLETDTTLVSFFLEAEWLAFMRETVPLLSQFGVTLLSYIRTADPPDPVYNVVAEQLPDKRIEANLYVPPGGTGDPIIAWVDAPQTTPALLQAAIVQGFRTTYLMNRKYGVEVLRVTT